MGEHMTRLITIAVALAFALPLVANANDTSKGISKSAAATRDMPIDVSVTEIKTEAKIVELDKHNRTAVLRTPMGKLITIQVPDKVQNFDKVQVGDDLVIRYQVAVAMEVEPTSKSDIRERIESSNTQTAKPGSLPGIEKSRKVEIIANVTAINRKAKTMTLRGATRTVTVAIPDNINVAKLKVGDEVYAVIVDAVMIDVENKPA
jgi:hypothetical protein